MKKLLLTLAAATLATGSVLAEKLDPAKADVKVTITGNDLMKYDKAEFEVKSGEVVAVTLKNVGKHPIEIMGHNIVFLKPGTDIVQFALGGISNKPGGFLPKDPKLASAIVANSKIIGPGQEETIVFKAGPAGDYAYVCTFPGHFGIMRGVMKVK